MKRNKRILDILVFVFLAALSFIMLYPFIWMVFTSLKPKMHVYIGGLVPQVWDFSSYTQIWDEIPLVRGFLNTLLYSLPPIIVGALVSGAAAFAFAKIPFKGRNVLFLLLLVSLMIPYPTIMVPQFVLFSEMKLLTTPWPLILPKLFGNVAMIFFLRQYIYNVPDSVIDAAKIDGSNYLGMYTKVVLPMISPALAAHAVLWFIGSWNDYLAPTILIRNPIWQPVTVMVAKFNEQYAINAHVPRMMAGSVLLLLPVLLIYGIFQRYIIGSFMFSGMKE